MEAGEAFPDEYILENANRVIKLKSNKDKTDDELIELTIKRVRKNRKRLIDIKDKSNTTMMSAWERWMQKIWTVLVALNQKEY